MHSFLNFSAQTWSRLSLFRLLATPTHGDIELRQSYLPVEQEKPLEIETNVCSKAKHKD